MISSSPRHWSQRDAVSFATHPAYVTEPSECHTTVINPVVDVTVVAEEPANTYSFTPSDTVNSSQQPSVSNSENNNVISPSEVKVAVIS